MFVLFAFILLIRTGCNDNKAKAQCTTSKYKDGHWWQTCSKQKGVYQTMVFTVTGGNRISSFINFFFKNTTGKTHKIVLLFVSSVPVCRKILTKMPKCGTSDHISFILICHYTNLYCSFMSSCYYLSIIHWYCHFSLQPKFIFQYMCKYNFTGLFMVIWNVVFHSLSFKNIRYGCW
jgi:hypothetical protein